MTERGIGDLGKAIARVLERNIPGLGYRASEALAEAVVECEDFKSVMATVVEREAIEWIEKTDRLGEVRDEGYHDGYDAGYEDGWDAGRDSLLDAGYVLPEGS